MSFVAGFYTLSLEVNNPDAGVFDKIRIKVQQHLLESNEALLARLVAFGHSYRSGLEFSSDPREHKSPTLSLADSLGNLIHRIFVGLPDVRYLQHSLKSLPQAETSIYLFSEQQISQFCHLLRGSRANWIESIRFHFVDPATLQWIEENFTEHWSFTVIDSYQVYIALNGESMSLDLSPINMWSRFQVSIRNVAEES